MFLGDRQPLCRLGTFVYVPRGIAHTFEVESASPGKKVNLFSPAAMTGLFEYLAAAGSGGGTTPEMLDVIAARNHMGVAGPCAGSSL